MAARDKNETPPSREGVACLQQARDKFCRRTIRFRERCARDRFAEGGSHRENCQRDTLAYRRSGSSQGNR